MPGAVITIEDVGLAVVLERLLVLVNLSWTRPHVVVAEQADERHVQVRRHIDHRHWLVGGQAVRRDDDVATPQIGHRAETLHPRGDQQRVPTARARADNRHLAITRREALDQLERGFGIGDHRCVGDATRAARSGCNVVGRALAESLE